MTLPGGSGNQPTSTRCASPSDPSAAHNSQRRAAAGSIVCENCGRPIYHAKGVGYVHSGTGYELCEPERRFGWLWTALEKLRDWLDRRP